MVLGEPLLVMGDTPTVCGDMIWALLELIKPVRFKKTYTGAIGFLTYFGRYRSVESFDPTLLSKTRILSSFLHGIG
jgi:hypothetical protein